MDGVTTKDERLPKEERLRNRGAVSQLFSAGDSKFSFPIRCIIREVEGVADGGALSSVLFSVPKRFHKRANKRNLLRRRMKEAYRLNKSLLADGTARHIALIYTTKEVHDYSRIERSIKKILMEI